MKNHRKSLFALVLALVMALTLGMTACAGGGGNKPGPDKDPDNGPEATGTYTYRTYTVTSPSNWNLLTQTDNNDRQVSNYLTSGFFEFDFKRDAAGKIIDGAFNVQYSAATKLEDVTAQYAGNEKWGIPEGTTGNRAWKLTLRNDLKWNDGTAIKAEDFVYSMEQTLDPKFKNRLASEYYSSNAILHNARDYVYQGSSGWFPADGPYTDYVTDLDDKIVFTLGNTAENTEKYGAALCSMRTSMGFPESFTAAMVAEYLVANGFNKKIDATKEEILALEGKKFSEIKADAALKATWDQIIASWKTAPNEELDFFVTYYTYPAMSMSDVGIMATGEYELTLIFDNTFNFIDGNGNLTYETAYYMKDLPLVKRDLYEASKKAPAEGATLWTSNYGSSLATTASWGPYMLTDYQAGTTYTLSKNANWYGYGMDQYKDQYQTDYIVCRTIPEWSTAWQAFQLGELDEIGIDPSVAATYRTSSQAVFTPSDLVASVHLQSSREALEEQQKKAGANVNKTILMQNDFRKALSLAIDRAAYAQAATTSSLAGLGYFNSCHYYDVANGGRYRDTEVAKKALLLTYGATYDEATGKWTVGTTAYDNIDDAEEALTGYNITLARELVDKAYAAAKAAGDIKDTDTVVLKFGTSEDNTNTRRHYDFLNNAWVELMKGTALESRFKTEFEGTHGKKWADDFRSGQFEVAPASGYSGGAWNPAYFIGSEVSMNMNSLRYNSGWDTTKESLKISFKNAAGDNEEYTLTIDDWYNSLTGSGGTQDFSLYPTESRLTIVAALEQAALQSYWDIPTFYSFSAQLHSYKTEYATYEYNTFMAYGGVRYMTYNYSDAKWTEYVASQPNKTLDYTK